MPRKKKTETEVPAAEPQNGAGATPSPSGRARKSSSPKAKKSTRKAPAARKPKSAVTLPATIEPSEDEIRIRAYFIAERRHRLALGGDADSDWLEAKRQLLQEVQPR